jgi:hypothetical protein
VRSPPRFAGIYRPAIRPGPSPGVASLAYQMQVGLRWERGVAECSRESWGLSDMEE